MNFSLIQPTDSNYNKIMMQKHLDQKRKRKDNVSQNSQCPYAQDQNNRKFSNYQNMCTAGLTLLNNNSMVNGNSSFIIGRKKQLNQQNQKMKKLLKDELQKGLTEHNNMKKLQNQQSKKLRKVMSVQNGMLDYLQKQINKRDDFIKHCLIKQEIRKNQFIDQDMRKHHKALQHINQNIDNDIFNHQSDRYQQKQKEEFQKTLQTNNQQAETKKVQRQLQRSQYGRYLDEKYKRQKHNPITNPMQYHVQNPYIRRKLQNY